jgi:hypothetical protein
VARPRSRPFAPVKGPAPRAEPGFALRLVPALLITVAAAVADPVTIRWLPAPAPGVVEFIGVPAEMLQGLERKRDGAGSPPMAVFVDAANTAAPGKVVLPPMAGTWRVEPSVARFEPRFPLVHGVRYRAEYRPRDGTPVVSYFELPVPERGPPTEVVRVFPSADTLPENQLKFYVQFSAPMSRGGTYAHVQIRDAMGSVIDLPFLELEEELWDPAMTRLTLLIDPGRIKRGVKPLEDIGPVFEAGKEYSLTVDAACRDAAGQPLRGPFEKRFRVAGPDRVSPDPKRWTLAAPTLATRDPLRVEFDEPMDHALALRLIRVTGEFAAATPIRGEAALGRKETSWQFTPAEPWRSGKYRLTVATTIEDLAGNNIGKTFDVDLSAGGSRRVTKESVSVPFEVR